MSKRAEAKRKNCLSCNKSMRRIDWYYRDGGFFCNKTCFKNHLAKKAAEQEAKKQAKAKA